MTNISIFGSCVSRDAMEICLKNHPDVCLKTYIARQSIISAVSPPIAFDESEIHLASAFQKRMVACDLSKKTFDLLAGDGSEYLLVDLIDERFHLVQLQNSYVTLSSELINASFLPEGYRQIRRQKDTGGGYSFQGISMVQYAERFIDRLLQIYPPNHIILHSSRMCNEYIDLDGSRKEFTASVIGNNAVYNSLYDALYGIFAELLPSSPVITCGGRYLADASHKWGLSSIHFQPAYYQEITDQLLAVISSGES